MTIEETLAAILAELRSINAKLARGNAGDARPYSSLNSSAGGSKRAATANGIHEPGQPWTVFDAAKFLGISDRHLRRLIDLGKVKTIRMGRRVMLPDAAVQRLADYGVEV